MQDVGFANILSKTHLSNNNAFTFAWAAPEVRRARRCTCEIGSQYEAPDPNLFLPSMSQSWWHATSRTCRVHALLVCTHLLHFYIHWDTAYSRCF